MNPLGLFLEPLGPILTHLHTVHMVYSERLPTRLNPLAERTCFSQAAMRSMLGQGVTGFRIERACAKGDASWLGSAGVARMWAVAAETRQAVCCMAHPEDLGNISAMCGRFPGTTVVIDHLGSIGENKNFGGTGVVEDWELRALLGLAEHPRVHVKLSAFYALGEGA